MLLALLHCCMCAATVSERQRACAGGELWAAVPMWPQQAPITENNATKGLMFLETRPAGAQHVCVVSGGGTLLRGGLLELHGTSALVFEGSCAGVEVADCEISGAAAWPSSCAAVIQTKVVCG